MRNTTAVVEPLDVLIMPATTMLYRLSSRRNAKSLAIFAGLDETVMTDNRPHHIRRPRIIWKTKHHFVRVLVVVGDQQINPCSNRISNFGIRRIL